MPNKRYRPSKSRPPANAWVSNNGKIKHGHSAEYAGREYWFHPTKGYRSKRMPKGE